MPQKIYFFIVYYKLTVVAYRLRHPLTFINVSNSVVVYPTINESFRLEDCNMESTNDKTTSFIEHNRNSPEIDNNKTADSKGKIKID